MKIKVITSYKPGTWKQYAKRAVDSVIEHWPDVDIDVYHEGSNEESKSFHEKVEWIDLHEAQPELLSFKKRHKDDPVANGELQEIPNGVRRPTQFQGSDKNKGSYLFDSVRFANKVFCVTHSIKTSIEKSYDYVVWLDADTYTFRDMPRDFLESLLPSNTMVTYLGRENPEKNDGGKYPECGFVGYNLRNPNIQSFASEWEDLYISDKLFELTEWHDSYVFWHLTKKYRKQHNIEVNDIGYWVGVKGHHVFINSQLGLYMDHFKGKRKNIGTSAKNDLRGSRSSTDVSNIDYWKKVPSSL